MIKGQENISFGVDDHGLYFYNNLKYLKLAGIDIPDKNISDDFSPNPKFQKARTISSFFQHDFNVDTSEILKEAKISDHDKVRVANFFSCDESKFKNEVFAKKPSITHFRIGSKVKWYLLMGTDNLWEPLNAQKWDINSILERLSSEN